MLDGTIEEIVKKARHVIVLGFGTSGQAATFYFRDLPSRPSVTVIEKQSRESFFLKPSNKRKVLADEKLGVTFSFGDVLTEKVLKSDPSQTLCVISPGIARSSTTAQKLSQLKIRLLGELELGLGLTKVPAIMVTGSNGKSTTVSLIDSILTNAQQKSFLCGNIGKPVLTLLHEPEINTKPDVLVVEASSYQLESADSVKPKVAAILNFCENHLERHKTMDNYLRAKAMIARNQTPAEFIILNRDDAQVTSLQNSLKGTVAFFGKDPSLVTNSPSAFIRYEPAKQIDEVVVSLPDIAEKIIFPCRDTKLVGEHARYNIAAAALSVLLYCDRKKDLAKTVAAIQKSIQEFPGLEHRLQPVPTHSEFLAINDSKSTTVTSSIAAIQSIAKAFPGRPIMLLLGGKVKLGSWEPLAQAVNAIGSSVHIACFGGDGLFIQQELQSFGVTAHLAKNVAIAVTYACDWRRDNEILLFSPGCASFDEFTDFEARGRFFASLVALR